MTVFFDMGGYGAFIWPSYIISAIVLIALVLGGVWRMRQVKLALAEFEPDDTDQAGPKA